MDKPVLKNSLELFATFGKVKSRSMFGGFGVFVDDTMFALVVKNALHIRCCEALNQRFTQQAYQPYVYKKRGFPVVTKYFQLPEDLWGNTDDILHIANIALDAARKEKQSSTQVKPARLKDLPNLRLGTERLLKKAGISSVEDLRQAGSLQAFKAIQSSHSDTLNIELLWALEGALNGTHWSVVPLERRSELIEQLKS
ncbi:TfoX/Sxy family DNA transformation protein [Vibrio sp. TH_r3]|uniref:TfoX/Sxy family DNA transformation protein n=1 Tax=Vibrio sp. TH_r3 TaxID=3082084 RepID=UPI0029545A82|nr:TfoX/Sxy family DNA transformation protein [Vibrio sp. TH_r3]MDV7102990.1 TfoX/Sxy family DNA transformation protein [Vibrio sp. TH_r3]